jgi:hypothetical protein
VGYRTLVVERFGTHANAVSSSCASEFTVATIATAKRPYSIVVRAVFLAHEALLKVDISCPARSLAGAEPARIMR